MKNIGIRGLFIVATTAVLAACAAQAPVSPAPAVAAAAAATAPSAAAASTAEVAAAKKKLFPTTGYRKVVKNGVELYCSKDGYTGSRVASTEECLTAAQLQTQQENARNFLLRQQSRVGEQPGTDSSGGSQYGAASPAR